MKNKNEKPLITSLLTLISKLHRTRTNAMLTEAGIHAGQDILLYFLISEDGQTVSSLVERMCNQHATLFTMLERMESTGMIKKEKDVTDKRISRVFITKKGRHAYKRVTQTWEHLETTALKGIKKDQEEVLRQLLLQIQTNLR